MTPKVTLLSHTPQPEKLVAAAARMCYSAASADTIWEGLDEEKTQNFIDICLLYTSFYLQAFTNFVSVFLYFCSRARWKRQALQSIPRPKANSL